MITCIIIAPSIVHNFWYDAIANNDAVPLCTGVRNVIPQSDSVSLYHAQHTSIVISLVIYDTAFSELTLSETVLI